MGEWIEIVMGPNQQSMLKVSPFMGEWIEIANNGSASGAWASLTLHG